MRQLFAIVLIFSTVSLHAQSRSDVFNKDVPVTWLGLDFSGAKFIGDRARLGSESDLRRFITAWNEIFLTEPEKYDVARAIGRASVTNAIEVTREHNEALEVLPMLSEQQKDYLHLQMSDVREIVAGYDFGNLSGIGLMFVVESFSKMNQEASVWVTFVDMGTKQVLFTERLIGRPGGAGLRNYWANSQFEVLRQIQKREFEMWRKKYHRP